MRRTPLNDLAFFGDSISVKDNRIPVGSIVGMYTYSDFSTGIDGYSFYLKNERSFCPSLIWPPIAPSIVPQKKRVVSGRQTIIVGNNTIHDKWRSETLSYDDFIKILMGANYEKIVFIECTEKPFVYKWVYKDAPKKKIIGGLLYVLKTENHIPRINDINLVKIVKNTFDIDMSDRQFRGEKNFDLFKLFTVALEGPKNSKLPN